MYTQKFFREHKEKKMQKLVVIIISGQTINNIGMLLIVILIKSIENMNGGKKSSGSDVVSK